MLKLVDYVVGFESDLAARNRSSQTTRTYLVAAQQFMDWLEAEGHSTVAAEVTPNDVRRWLASMHERGLAPATVAQRYRSLQQFWNFVVGEGDSGCEVSPMARLKPPTVPEKPIPIFTEPELKSIVAACNGTDFESRRDLALIRMFIDTGARLAEITNARLEDVDLRNRTWRTVVKGRHERDKNFGPKTGLALDRYLRARRGHRYEESPYLWIGKRGRLQSQGVRRVVERRGEEAGLGHIHPHQFRHTMAHRWLADGTGTEGELMRLMGWKSRAMLDRYGASAADERARDSYRRFVMENEI